MKPYAASVAFALICGLAVGFASHDPLWGLAAYGALRSLRYAFAAVSSAENKEGA